MSRKSRDCYVHIVFMDTVYILWEYLFYKPSWQSFAVCFKLFLYIQVKGFLQIFTETKCLYYMLHYNPTVVLSVPLSNGQ